MFANSTIDEEKIRSAAEKLRQHQLELQIVQLRAAVLGGDAQQVVMALPMLLALTICPAMLGTQEAIRQSQSKNKREEHRARRCNLVASCVKPSIRSRDINGKLVVLRDSKLYIAHEPSEDEANSESTVGHPFAGYFLPYPDSNYEGLVSTICEEPPILNWIYVDRDTYEVKYGLRVEAQAHITGPFDCTRQDRRMSLEGWEGFVAVEELPGVWALYYDREDNGLRSKVPLGTRVLEVELTRREKKEPKPRPSEEPQTLDEMMKKHKEQTAREEAERAEFAASVGNVPTGTNQEHQQEGDSPAPLRAGPTTSPLTADAQEYSLTGKRIEPSSFDNSSEGNPLSPTVASAAGWSLPGDAGDDAATIATSVAGGAEEFGEVRESLSGYVKPYVEEDDR